MKTGARSRGTLVLAHASPEQLLGQEAIPGPPRQPVQPWEEADDRHSPHCTQEEAGAASSPWLVLGDHAWVGVASTCPPSSLRIQDSTG